MRENEQDQQAGAESASEDDPLVEEQKGKGYGEDEGERDDSLGAE